MENEELIPEVNKSEEDKKEYVFDIEKYLPEDDPKEIVLNDAGQEGAHPFKAKMGRKSTGVEYLDKLNNALELILYKKLDALEFRKVYSKMYNVSEAGATAVWSRCKKILLNRHTAKNEEIIAEQLSRYYDLLDRARQDGNKRVERETLWDISRIYGLEQKKVDITSDGMPIDIRINLSNDPKDFNK